MTAETESKESVQVIVERKRRDMSATLKYLAATVYTLIQKTLTIEDSILSILL